MSVVETGVYTALLPVVMPFHCMFARGLAKAQQDAPLKPKVDEILAVDPTTEGVPTPRYMPAELEADYLTHRSAAYVEAMVKGSARELARWAAGTSTVEDVSDADVARAFLASPPALLIRRNDADSAWLLDCAFLATWEWFEPAHFEVVAFEFDLDRGFFEIRDTAGKAYHPGEPLWASARRKLIAQMSLWTPMGHNWTHFWFPDVIAATAWQRVPEGTNLRRLLEPHIRFANRHNHAGIWVQRSTNNEPGLGKKLVPWLVFPIRALPMRAVFAGGAQRFHERYDIFTFADTADRRIPYFDYLGQHHAVVARFVDRVLPSLEADALAAWQAEVARWFPRAAEVTPAVLLTTALWLIGVAHATEHLTYVDWSRRFGHADVATPIAAPGGGEANGYDRYRFLAFVNNFVDFRPPTTGLDLRLVTTDEAYGFAPGSDAAQAATAFVAELRALNTQLRGKPGGILELDRLIRCICF